MKKLILRFNANPAVTFEKVIGLSNSLGLMILSVEDQRAAKSILHKVVTITGDSADMQKLKEKLVRVPAVTFREE